MVEVLPAIPSASAITISMPSAPPARERPTLQIFFSAPLAWKDRSGQLHPIEMLDYGGERDLLVQVFQEVRRDVSLCFEDVEAKKFFITEFPNRHFHVILIIANL